MKPASRRETGARYTGKADSLLLGLLGLFLLTESCGTSRSIYAQAPATCAVSGTVLNGLSQPIAGTQVTFRVVAPTLATNGAGIASQNLTTATAADGTWSLTLIQGLNAQVDIPAVGIRNDVTIPTGASCPAAFGSLVLYNRGTLTPATILSTVGPSMGGDLTGSSPNPTVIGLRGQPLAAGNCSNGQARVYNSGTSSYTCQAVTAGAVVTQVAGGTAISITGTASVPIVNVATVPVTSGGTGATSLAAGVIHGSGTSPLTSSAVALGSEVSGQLGIANGGTGAATAVNAYNALAPTTTAGDFAYANGAGTNTRVAGNATATRMFLSEASSVPGFGVLVAGDIPSLPATILTSGTVNTAQLPAAGGDLSGTLPAATVTAIRGNAVKVGVPSNGNVLTWVTANTDWEPAAPVGAVASVAGSGGTTGLTLTGGPTGAVTLTLGGTLAVADGGTGATTTNGGFNALSPMTTLGDVEYEDATPKAVRLGGNTTTAGMFLHSVGTGSAANAPVWSQVDLTTDVTNTLPVNKGGTGAATLTGILIGNGTSPVTAQAIPLTVAQGGSGATTLTGLLRGNGTSPITGGGQASLTTEVTGVLPVANGGTNGLLPIANGGTGQTTAPNAFNALAPTTTTGDVIYANGSGTNTRLAGNSSTTPQFLTSTGTGAAAQAPTWNALSAANIPAIDFSKVTTGVVPVAQGGTGQTTASAAFSALDPMTVLGDTMYGGAGGVATALAGNTSATKQFLTQTGNGTISAAPAWGTLVAGDVPNLDASKITTGSFSTGLIPAIAGDVTGAYTGVTVGKLQGRAVSATAPTNTYCLTWVTANADWEPQPCSSGGSSITSVNASGGTTGFSFTGGPITTGVGVLTLTGTLGIANGGTGQTTANAGFNALSPLTTLGDVLYGGASGAATRLAGNTTTTPMFLKSTGSAGLATAPAFQQVSASTDLTGTLPVGNGGTGAATFSAGYVKSPGGTGILTTQATPIPVSDGGTGASTLTGLLQGNGASAITGGAIVNLATQVTGVLPVANGGSGGGGGFTLGSVIFTNGSGNLAQDNANFFWDSTNHRLGIGTASPAVPLSVARGTAGNFALFNGTGTSGAYNAIQNTGGSLEYGVDSSSGGYIATGSLAYSSGVGTTNATALHLYTNNTTANGLTVAGSTGYVGIGTTAPATPFTVTAGSASIAAATVTASTATSGYDALDVVVPSGNLNGAGIKITGQVANGGGAVIAEHGGSTTGCYPVGGAICGSSSTGPSGSFIAGATAGQNWPTVVIGGISGQTKDLWQAVSAAAGQGASGIDSNGNYYVSSGVGGSTVRMTIGSMSESLTLSTSGTTTDTVGYLLPANSIIKAVTIRIATSITIATNLTVGDSTTAARFVSSIGGMSTGYNTVGLNAVDQTGAAGPKQISASKVRITTTGTPGAGVVNITTYFETFAD